MNFQIKAYKASQGTVLLHYDAANLHDALRRAEAEGYKIISSKAQRLLPSFTRRYRFPLVLFSQELYSLLEAGLPLLEAIETLAAKEQQPHAKAVYAGLNRLLYEGRPLSQAMQEYADAFPVLYIATIRASEHTGELRQALSRYLAYHGQLDAVRKKVVSAAIYPVLLMLVGSLVILFLMVYVVPFGTDHGFYDYVRTKPDGTLTQVRNGKAYDVNGNRVRTDSPEAHGITPDKFTFHP